LHAWCGRVLRDVRLLPRQFEQLSEATLVITRQSERIRNRISKHHVENDSASSAVGKEAK
jgi:hypothetical protein